MKKIVIILTLLLVMMTGCKSQPKEEIATETKTNVLPEETVEQTDITTFETSQGTVELVNTSVLSDKMEILIPSAFTEMSDEMAKIKYPEEEAPTLIYTNEEGSINVAFSLTENPAKEEELPLYVDALKQSLTELVSIETWYSSESLTQNNMTIGKLEFLTPAADTNVYNLMYLISFEDQLLLCSFNSTEELMEEWKPIAQTIMSSLKMK